MQPAVAANVRTASSVLAMPRETIDEKAIRYLHERRIRVVRIDGDRVYGRARGERDVYQLVAGGGRSRCTCPARVRCCHLAALELIAAALPTDLARHTQPTATAVGSTEPVPRGLLDAARHAKYHEARTREREEPEPAWETAAGGLVLDHCPDCGTYERVAVQDGRCPTCTRS
jgi:uncharacterized Zn finger protein